MIIQADIHSDNCVLFCAAKHQLCISKCVNHAAAQVIAVIIISVIVVIHSPELTSYRTIRKFFVVDVDVVLVRVL